MLRDYQEKIVGEVRGHIKDGCKRLLIQSPTGSGKTVLTAYLLNNARKYNRESWFIVHRRELIEQTKKTFDRHGIPHGVIAAGHERRPGELVQICSLGTLTRHIDEFKPPRMCAWDECHHIGAESWERVYKACADATNIGMSATPSRPGGRTLGKWFDKMVHGPTVPWLQERGYLSQFKYFAPNIPDMSEVSSIGGDYNPAEVEKIMKGRALVGDIVKHWHRLAYGKKTIGFAPSVAASLDYVAAFHRAGVRAAHIDGTTPDELRRTRCMQFATGEIDVLWNVALFGEGFDLSAYAGFDAVIEAAILANPTQSEGKCKQEWGRTLRPKPEPAVIIDHAGNFTRHGLPDDLVEYSLTEKPRRVILGGTAVPICQCDNCSRVFPPAAVCPHCGWERPIKERRMFYLDEDLKQVERSFRAAELAAAEAEKAERKEEAARRKAEAEALRLRQAAEVRAARTLEQLQKIEHERGYKHGWAIMKYKHRKK